VQLNNLRRGYFATYSETIIKPVAYNSGVIDSRTILYYVALFSLIDSFLLNSSNHVFSAFRPWNMGTLSAQPSDCPHIFTSVF